MSRRGFTLIELLVVVAILAIMVTAGVVSVTAGQGAARVKGAARDVVASIRHARSVALVSQEPAVITFANQSRDGETVASVKIDSAKLITDNPATVATTLEGDEVRLGGDDDAAADGAAGAGESFADILFSPVSEDVMQGVRLKVVTGEEAEDDSVTVRTASKISVFSTADYITSRYQSKTAAEKAADEEKEESSDTAADEGNATPVSIVWEANGRTEPHRVWVYRDGTQPESGLLIKVDRFGAVKVLSGDGSEEDGE